MPKTLPERFHEKVAQSPDGCWIWTAATDKDGYGKFGLYPGTVRAPRLAFALHRGPIPEGMQTDHLCRNRRCVNPYHLELVTTAENSRRAAVIRTHCPQGHPYDSTNTWIEKTGARHCRTCNRDRQRALRKATR